MPLKKKKISELNEASDMKGFFTIGYRVINGVKTSLKFGLEKIQTALDNMLKATSDAKTATTDMRQLEATVESNESARETAESVVMLPNNPGRQPKRIVPVKSKPGKCLLNQCVSLMRMHVRPLKQDDLLRKLHGIMQKSACYR